MKKSGSRLLVYDVQGKLVAAKMLEPTQKAVLDLRSFGLSDGMYTLKLVGASMVKYSKIALRSSEN